VEICDTGSGMDDATKRRCLEPFFTTKGERGTGLGLAMVYGMAQRQNAEIEIESEPGRGTTVRLVFLASAPGVIASPAPPPPVGPPLRILIIDDDPLLVRALRDILESDDHLVTSACGGHEGVEAFEDAHRRREAFDMVFSDLGMPYFDGRKVAACIKELSPETPVVLLTGWGTRLAAERDIPQSVDRILNKPPRLQDLRTAIADLATAKAEQEPK
jgi:CheY-like chemotaxis protein